MLQNASSAAVMIGALWVIIHLGHTFCLMTNVALLGVKENNKKEKKIVLDKNHHAPAVTRIRTWVVAATTRSTNHYTITAIRKR